MTIKELALKIGVSPAFIRRVLQGEDHLAKLLTMQLMADIMWATGQWMSISGSPSPDVEPDNTVKGAT